MLIQFLLQSYPVIVSYSILFHFLISSDFSLLYFFILLQLNEPLNTIFKNIFKSDRPDGASNCGIINNPNKIATTFGMPSGHSQVAWFISIYLILYLYNKQDYTYWKYVILIILPLLVMYSRIYMFNCHTPMQTIVGAIFGIILGYLAFKINNFNVIKN